MKIPIVGMDPSMTHWGIAEGQLCLTEGILDSLRLSVVKPEKMRGKQVRVNSEDMFVSEQLAIRAIEAAKKAKAVFVECPVGSQSARAMASYGMCVGILGAIRAAGIPLIEVTAAEAKLALTGDRNATKQNMIDEALRLYPDVEFPNQRGRITNDAEHVADAIGAIHAGANTSQFQNLIRLLRSVT